MPPDKCSCEGVACFRSLLYAFSTHYAYEFDPWLTWIMQARKKVVHRDTKLQRLLYLMYKINPLLRHIQKEQRAELDVEARILGTWMWNSDGHILLLRNKSKSLKDVGFTSCFQLVCFFNGVHKQFAFCFVGKIIKEEDIMRTRLDQDDRLYLSLIHISEPTRRTPISYA